MDQKPVSLNTVIIASAVTCVVLGGLIFASVKNLDDKYAQASMEQQEVIESLKKKVTALETQTTELAGRPTTDTSTIDGLKTDLTTANSTINELKDRLAELEKKPEPAPAPAETASTSASLNALKAAVTSGAVYEAELDIWEKENPKSGKKIAKLRANADVGIATEEELRAQLREIVAQQNASQEKFPENSMVSRINNRLSGLISIKKQSDASPTAKALHDSIGADSIEGLKAKVNALPDTQKGVYNDWLQAVDARASVLAELKTLDNAQ